MPAIPFPWPACLWNRTVISRWVCVLSVHGRKDVFLKPSSPQIDSLFEVKIAAWYLSYISFEDVVFSQFVSLEFVMLIWNGQCSIIVYPPLHVKFVSLYIIGIFGVELTTCSYLKST